MFSIQTENGSRFDYEFWQRWRHDRLIEYPCQRGKWRFDIELTHPRENLGDVPVDHSPHRFYGPHACFYSSRDWSTIFGAYPAYHPSGESLRMLVESGNRPPLWGEQITLLSTSSCIQDEEWGRNPANKFAYFRERYWKISWHQFLHNGYREIYDVYGGYIRYPISMSMAWGGPVFDPLPRPLTFRQIWLDETTWIYPSRFERLPENRIDWKEEGF